MAENLEPTSKVIQISTDILKIQDGVIGFTTTKLCTQITALCDDGSIWLTNNMEKALGESWYCILEAPKPTAPIIPIPGSWWKKGREKVQVSEVYFSGLDTDIFVNYSDAEDYHHEKLETFLEMFKPLEADNAK